MSMRLLWLFLILALLIVLPFLIWGESFEDFFSHEGTIAWLDQFGKKWAWAPGMLLLAADLVLPVPGTVVMAALGFLYGPLAGGLISATGSFLSGLLAYQICSHLGRRAAERIAGARDLARGERLFGGNAAGWIVALSRWLPVLPEVVACMAGLARMPRRRFCLALLCGSLPLGFTFAAIGSAGHENPGIALLVSALLPPALWAAMRPFVARNPE